LWESLVITIEMHYIAGVSDQYNKWMVEQLDGALAATSAASVDHPQGVTARRSPGFWAN